MTEQKNETAVQSNQEKEEQAAQSGELQQFLTFHLDDEEYGVDITQVMEIRGWSETTRLPNTPEYVMGIINLRGVVVPVMDIRRRFGMEPAQLGEKSVVIILSSTERSLGLLVDGVTDILEVASSSVKAPPTVSDSIESDFLQGLVAEEKRMVVILNPEKLFSIRILEDVEHKAAQLEE